ncbi:CheY-like receiver domain-containing protein [Rivularia sp. PCC 7116]|uniref:response regulator n=1 Tax=Rivularia sp. PCC 7116 TaxID=373994 RepID=UPI00029ECFBE|nr:response regulator [Rivularia sp. PCC 7116]AFY59096.1 CheY-like receiver domain-containing protein [Rivularia sp. PCC 7116]
MSTTPIDSYKLFQKLHPLSLLAQISSRRATGCLRVFTKFNSWSIYMEEGKLIYASCSESLFERLDTYLRRLNQQIPTLNSSARVQMRMIFEKKNEDEPISQADYQAICWLVDGDYITYPQAETLINELAKEVLQSFLKIKEGSYEFRSEHALSNLPSFCYLDLRSLIESVQKKLRNRRVNQQQDTSPTVPPVVDNATELPRKVKPLPEVEKQLPKQIDLSTVSNSQDNNNTNISKNTKERLYTVACIDDSLTILKSIQRFLDEDNFSVVMINDPVKALMQILRSKPDLILLDVEMPNLDGYELCSLLRRHSAFKDIPIVMVTGRTGFIDRAKAKMVRASGYLTKPFTQSELLKVVFKHIS